MDPKSKEVLDHFTKVLFGIRERHASTVPIMAEAVMEVKSHYGKTEKSKVQRSKAFPHNFYFRWVKWSEPFAKVWKEHSVFLR